MCDFDPPRNLTQNKVSYLQCIIFADGTCKKSLTRDLPINKNPDVHLKIPNSKRTKRREGKENTRCNMCQLKVHL
jgi:hypothetical protein